MRIVIVGAGVTGLALSILLARFGHTSTVVEKHSRTAPLLRGFARKGLHFDTGFHLAGGLQPGGALHTWLHVLGIMTQLQPVPLRPDSALLFRFPDGDQRVLPCGFEAVRRMTAQDFPGHEQAVAALLQDMNAVAQASPYMSDSASPALLAESCAESASLSRKLADLPPKLATMLSSYTLLYGVPPESTTWKQFSVVAAPFLQGSHTLHGGGKSLALALENKARALGVDVQCGQGVMRLDIAADRTVQGLCLDNGTRLACDVCVFTGHPGQLPSLIDPGTFRPAYLCRIAELEETLSPLLLFGQTRSDFLDRRALYLPGGLTPDALFAAADLEERTAYVVCGETNTGAHADGRRPLMAVTTCPPLPESPDDYAIAKAQLTERFAASIRSRCPELGDLVVLDAATPKTMRRWIHGGSGSLYGVCHGSQSGELQPATRVRGLLLAGQNILLPGVLGCIISAAVAAGLLVGHESVFEEFARCVRSA